MSIPGLVKRLAKGSPITAQEHDNNLVLIEGAVGSAAQSAEWGSVSGKPSTFPPATHGHAISDVTGLQAELDPIGTALQPGAQIPWTDVTGKPTFATVATSGSYADLINVPSTFAPEAHGHIISDVTGLQAELNGKQAALVSGTNIRTINGTSILGEGNIAIGGDGGGSVTWNDVLDKPAWTGVFDGTYSSLTGAPSLAAVATTGDYSDLTGLPALFDGAYASLTGIPATFPPAAHTHTLADVTDSGGAAALDVGATAGTVAAGDDGRFADAATHIAATDNPHSVTAAQVGLGNVDNTSDADKPISTATQSALDAKAALSALDGKSPNAQPQAAVAFSATVTLDLNGGADQMFGPLTLTGNATLANPSNAASGAVVVLDIRQDATGGRTLSYGSHWRFPGGAPDLSTAGDARDVLVGVVIATDYIAATLHKGVST